ncbi:MAG: ECF transporter S component [Euryarchaeota archaeon]|nr:ECF transporter S component [Euryarchaeota archaeon]
MYQTTQHKIAYAGVMAALMAVAGFFPAIPLFGLGKAITLGAIVMPMIGVLLGPFIGGYAALVGALIGETIAPYGAVFGFLTFIPPTLGAISAGLLSHKKWKYAFLLLGSLVLLWYCTDVGRAIYYFPYLHLFALLLILLFGRKLSDLENHLPLKLLIITFCAILTDHMAGNLVFFVVANPTKSMFSAILVQYSFERISMAVFSALIAVGVLKTLKEVNIWKIKK